MLTHLKIERLFDTFDYNIQFNETGITILTGPNGYGKTTILKILDALASHNLFFFLQLSFKRIEIQLHDIGIITLEKHSEQEIQIRLNNQDASNFSWSSRHFLKAIKRVPFFRQLENGSWEDRRTDGIYTPQDVLSLIQQEFPELNMNDELPVNIRNIPVPNIYFIREQRLLRTRPQGRKHVVHISERHGRVIEETNNFIRTIEEFAADLSDNILKTLAQASGITQELDSSFPRRLFDAEHGISEDEFKQRFEKVQIIQRALNQYSISEIKEETHPTYKPENARALYVYINDAEEKLKPYEMLLSKLKLFTEILNERRFSFKRIQISKEFGFKFINSSGLELALSDLSSGEQQEVVLLYELLFKAPVGSIVLIDEPELSLHVAWQKQFVSDLIEIQKLQQFNIIIATHSPQIVNGRWDLTVDLEVLHRETIS